MQCKVTIGAQDDYDQQLAVVFLQQVVRGRAIQNMVRPFTSLLPFASVPSFDSTAYDMQPF